MTPVEGLELVRHRHHLCRKMMMVISYNIVSVFFVVSSLEVACSKEAF